MMRYFNERITFIFYDTLRGKLSHKGDYFCFDLVFIQKNNQTKIFLKKPKPVQTNRFRFGLVF